MCSVIDSSVQLPPHEDKKLGDKLDLRVSCIRDPPLVQPCLLMTYYSTPNIVWPKLVHTIPDHLNPKKSITRQRVN